MLKLGWMLNEKAFEPMIGRKKKSSKQDARLARLKDRTASAEAAVRDMESASGAALADALRKKHDDRAKSASISVAEETKAVKTVLSDKPCDPT